MSDLIERQEVLDVLDGYIRMYSSIKSVLVYIKKTINKLPPAEPQERKGKWIIIKDGSNRGRCDNCGYLGNAWMNFCPMCGQDNRMEVDNE